MFAKADLPSVHLLHVSGEHSLNTSTSDCKHCKRLKHFRRRWQGPIVFSFQALIIIAIVPNEIHFSVAWSGITIGNQARVFEQHIERQLVVYSVLELILLSI
jgi:hypothetical protein